MLAIFSKGECPSWVDVLLRYFGAGNVDDAPVGCFSVEALGGIDCSVVVRGKAQWCTAGCSSLGRGVEENVIEWILLWTELK